MTAPSVSTLRFVDHLQEFTIHVRDILSNISGVIPDGVPPLLHDA